MNLRDNLAQEAAEALKVADAVTLGPKATVGDAVAALQECETGCVVVTENDKPVGILTERDILTKVEAGTLPRDTPISEVMTSPPEVIDAGCSVATVIRRMHRGGYRHMPLLDHEGRLRGAVSVSGIVEYLAEHVPAAVFNLPPDPAQKQFAREGA